MGSEGLTAAVEERFEEAQVPWLARLVEQPSCTREPDDVEAAATLLDERAEELGLRMSRHEAEAFAAHRVYETPATDDAPCLALVGHIDTVFPRALGFFGFRREGDTAFGPGVLDMKSGLTSIFSALEAVKRSAPERFERLAVRVIIVSDEEVGSPTSRVLFEALAPHIEEALVFEAGRAKDAIVTSRKGTGAFTIRARGRAAHAGLAHEDGVNAIHALALAVPRVEALSDHGRGVTFNVGLIEGGTSANTVPEHATCRVDGRYVDAADGDALTAALREAVEGTPLDGGLAGAALELEGHYHRPPMVATDADRALMRRYAACASRAGLGAGEAPRQGGGSDANLLSAAGIPCIDGLGPAGRGIHQTSEQCSLESLRRRTVALAAFLAENARK